MAARGIIARLLLDEGVIDEEQLRYAERVHLKLATEKPLAEVLQELFSIPAETIYTTLRERGTEIRLGELLVELGHLAPEHLEAALAIQREEPGSKTRLGEVLVEHQFIDEGGLVDILSLHLGVPHEEPDPAKIRAEDFPRLPVRWCQEYHFVPLRMDEDRTVVAFADPTSKRERAAAEEIYGEGRVVPVIARRTLIDSVLRKPGR